MSDKKVNIGNVLKKGRVMVAAGSITFLSYIALWGIGYIYLLYDVEKTVREISEVEKKINELRSEDVVLEEQINQMSRQTVVQENVEGLGLVKSKVPPVKLVIRD